MTYTRLPDHYATTTELGAGPATDTHGGWEVVRQVSKWDGEFDEMVVRVDAPFDLSRADDRAELTRIRDTLTAALNPTPSKVVQPRDTPVVRYLEVVEILDDPWHHQGLTPAWRERLRGLIAFTSANHEDVWDCADCGDDDPTPVGYRFVEVTREGPEFAWHPTVGVLENGVLRWLCEDCAKVTEPANTQQVEQAKRTLAHGVKW